MSRGRRVKTTVLCIALLLFSFATAGAQDGCTETYGNGATTITLATGSPGELGMLKVLAEAFNKSHDSRLCWKKAGSGASLKLLKDKQVDVMTDSSTWVAAKKELSNLKILFKGDPVLINTYHTLCQPEGATPGQPLAAALVDFVVSPEGQKLIADYGVTAYGEGLYNDAAYARQFDH